MTTAYVTHPRYTEHDFPGHPEHAGRIQAVWQQLDAAHLLPRMKRLDPAPVDDTLLHSVHSASYVEMLNWMVTQDRMVQFDSDTFAMPESAEVARLSAGGVVAGVDAVLSGRADNALAAVRPPGHHALADRGMGFCLLGNVPIAARFAQREYGLKRIMIVDYDVHHGNGTQDMFYADDSVLFISTHQAPFYPGTGSLNETGHGKGRGYTLNVPLRPGHGDESFYQVYQQLIWPAAQRFQPELILVSAGFDAHWKDPLAMLRLSLEGYAYLTHELIRMADKLASGRIVFALEGGYDLGVLAHGVRNIAHALIGDEDLSDPFGKRPLPSGEPDVTPLIEEVRRIHAL